MGSCPACGAAVAAALLAQHDARDCPARLLRCLHAAPPNACAWRGARSARAAHLAYDCPAQEVECGAAGASLCAPDPAKRALTRVYADPQDARRTCRARVPRGFLATHAAGCALRAMTCSTCGEPFASDALPAHAALCIAAVDVCTHCGAPVRRALALAHRCKPSRVAGGPDAASELHALAAEPHVRELLPRSKELCAAAELFAVSRRLDTAHVAASLAASRRSAAEAGAARAAAAAALRAECADAHAALHAAARDAAHARNARKATLRAQLLEAVSTADVARADAAEPPRASAADVAALGAQLAAALAAARADAHYGASNAAHEAREVVAQRVQSAAAEAKALLAELADAAPQLHARYDDTAAQRAAATAAAMQRFDGIVHALNKRLSVAGASATRISGHAVAPPTQEQERAPVPPEPLAVAVLQPLHALSLAAAARAAARIAAEPE